jgi:hypothetical protein
MRRGRSYRLHRQQESICPDHRHRLLPLAGENFGNPDLKF